VELGLVGVVLILRNRDRGQDADDGDDDHEFDQVKPDCFFICISGAC
jgi:hypothetical protein